MEIIAELGSTWYSPDKRQQWANLQGAVIQCAGAGATAIKVQVFTAKTLYSQKRAPKLYARTGLYEFPMDYLRPLFERAHENDLELWASVFDPDLVGPVAEYVDVLKLASGDLTYELLARTMLKAAREENRRFAFSTGAATLRETAEMIADVQRQLFPGQGICMHCVSAYPAQEDEIALRSGIEHGSTLLHGFSDHTQGCLAAQLALAAGYTIFEKHVRATAQAVSPDAAVALSLTAFAGWAADLRYADRILGSDKKVVQPSERSERLWARRGADGLRPTEGAREPEEEPVSHE